MPATNEQLLEKAAQRIGGLQISYDWLEMRYFDLQQALEAVTLDRDQVHVQYNELRAERDRLADRVRELEPPPATGPTPRRSHKRKVAK